MQLRTLARNILFSLAAAGTLASCNAASFTPASQIKSLRVLAVQKTPAYGVPGVPVDVRLLYWDGKADENSPRSLNVCFFDGCTNPPGDLYSGCYSQIGAQIAAVLASGQDPIAHFCQTVVPGSLPDASVNLDVMLDAGVLPDVSMGSEGGASGDDGGTSADGASSNDVGGQAHPDLTHQVSSVVPLPDGGIVAVQPPSGIKYGLKYLFFTACAGRLVPRPQGSANDLPLQCVDDAGNVLGPDDFVPGYSKLYVYEKDANGIPVRTNANPVINDLRFGTDSIFNNLGPSDMVPTAPVCPTADCEIDLKAVVPSDVAEIDEGSTDINGNPLREGVWVDFHANRGDFTKPTRLISDPTTGFYADNGTKFKVPAEPGPVRIWAVVHDNRGGVEWAEGKILVTP